MKYLWITDNMKAKFSFKKHICGSWRRTLNTLSGWNYISFYFLLKNICGSHIDKIKPPQYIKITKNG